MWAVCMRSAQINRLAVPIAQHGALGPEDDVFAHF